MGAPQEWMEPCVYSPRSGSVLLEDQRGSVQHELGGVFRVHRGGHFPVGEKAGDLLGATPAGFPLYDGTGWLAFDEWQIFTNATSAQFSH